ncbi:methyltransferase domain-containing protein [Fragilaria crotonensis]|nr:methyltransferase domain-containing protein [Fragilaria crotonensis]
MLLSLLVASVTFRAVPLPTQTSAIHEKNFHSMGGSNGNMTAAPRDDDFQLAFRESLGFFDDIPAHEWQRMKDITKGRVHHSKGAFRRNARGTPRYYAANWDPDFSCRFLENSLGQSRADGHKWVCDPHRLAKKEDCLVYSIGSNGNFVFEEDLQRQLPNCEIRVFDPTDYSHKMQESGLNKSNYHVWGLKPTHGEVIRLESSWKRRKDFKTLTFSPSRRPSRV